MSWSLDRACTADFLPDLLPIQGERGWETQCSFGLMSVVLFAASIVLALLPARWPGVLGSTWMRPWERAALRALCGAAVLVAGGGAYHHDGGWMLLGFGAAAAVLGAWWLGARVRVGSAPDGPTRGG